MAKKIFSTAEVQQRLETLPDDIKNLIYSSDMEDIVQRIGTKHQLHIDQVGLLVAEAGEVMLGFTEPQDFVPSLMETLAVDQPKAAAIAQDLNDLLFKKIQESMKNLQSKKPVPGVSTQSAQAAPAPAAPGVAPATMPAPLAPAPVPVAVKPDLSIAETMLQAKTVSTPVPAPTVKQEPPKPANYSADPYREPPL